MALLKKHKKTDWPIYHSWVLCKHSKHFSVYWLERLSINSTSCRRWWIALDDSSMDWISLITSVVCCVIGFIGCLLNRGYNTNSCLLVYKAQCGLAPQYLVDVCQPVSAVSGRSGLRSSTRSDLVVVRTETDFREHSFAVAAPLAWNRLPENIRNLQSLQLFRSSLKTHFISFSCTAWHRQAGHWHWYSDCGHFAPL